MAACPKCSCVTLDSNKFQEVPFGNVAGDALVATRNGRTADALSNLIAWLGLKLANSIRCAYRCSNCGHTF